MSLSLVEIWLNFLGLNDLVSKSQMQELAIKRFQDFGTLLSGLFLNFGTLMSETFLSGTFLSGHENNIQNYPFSDSF